MPRCRRIAAFAVVCLCLPALAAAWEEPAHWDDVGAVADWLNLDAQLYRFEGDMPFLDKSQKDVDQVARYVDTRRYEGTMATIGLADFLALSDAERTERIKAAHKHRVFVERFRMRMATYAQQARSNQAIGWGIDVADVRTMGNCLRALRTATGLDPANPYAWHLYALFSWVVGDMERADRALAGAEAALGEVPDGELTETRAAVALDRAWVARYRGDFAAATAALDQAVGHGAAGLEPVVLRGLIAALTGDEKVAAEQAGRLRSVEIGKFPTNLRGSGSAFSPEITNMGAWRTQPSNYASAWIMALFWLREGDVDMARATFGDYNTVDAHPLAWHFWQDAGRIYDATGRTRQAMNAWGGARMWRPYSPYFPVKIYGADLGRLTGVPGNQPVILAYDTFLIAGNPLAHAFMLASMVNADPEDMEAQGAAGRALEVLDRCRLTGVYPAQAHLLQGAVYHRMGDLQTAVFEVEQALTILEAQGNGPGYSAVLEELAQVQHDRSPSEVQEFFGQSGTLQARWAAPQDVDTEEQTLRATFAADPSDANRQALARFLIRYREPADGRELVAETARSDAEDLKLALEADRSLGDATLALELVEHLEELREEPAVDAAAWTLAAFICLDAGNTVEGEAALKRALELDPGNHALKIQMQLMTGGG